MYSLYKPVVTGIHQVVTGIEHQVVTGISRGRRGGRGCENGGI